MFLIPLFDLKQGGKDKACREIAEYLLECVKDANPTSSGQYNPHNAILPTLL